MPYNYIVVILYNNFVALLALSNTFSIIKINPCIASTLMLGSTMIQVYVHSTLLKYVAGEILDQKLY